MAAFKPVGTSKELDADLEAISKLPGPMRNMAVSPLPGISADDLLERAVRNARAPQYRKGQPHPRWVAVKYLFALGSGYSHELCRLFGLDPDEMVKR
jgi:hypothetical protein